MDAWLVVGLGNPGAKYAFTRHNIGFIFLDWMNGSSSTGWSNEHKALTRKEVVHGKKIIYAKPQTFMNLSGESVQPLAHFYKVDLGNIVVIQDEVDVAFGKMKFQRNRGHGGHNGIRDISEKLGSADYNRLRLGVGRPAHPQMQMTDHVLGNFTKEEQEQLPDFFKRAHEGIISLIERGLDRTTTDFNK